jgi:hypothetical protein
MNGVFTVFVLVALVADEIGEFSSLVLGQFLSLSVKFLASLSEGFYSLSSLDQIEEIYEI